MNNISRNLPLTQLEVKKDTKGKKKGKENFSEEKGKSERRRKK